MSWPTYSPALPAPRSRGSPPAPDHNKGELQAGGAAPPDPPAAPPDPHRPRLGPYLSRQTLASPARRPAEPPDHVHPPLDL